MNPPPLLLDGAKVLYYSSLREPVEPTGKHYIVIDGQSIFPANVAICQYENCSVFYRFYCDESWEVLSDVDNDSVEEAIEDVEVAYKGAAERFEKVV